MDGGNLYELEQVIKENIEGELEVKRGNNSKLSIDPFNFPGETQYITQEEEKKLLSQCCDVYTMNFLKMQIKNLTWKQNSLT